jgi:uncharacterized cupredoxin-like copper-binding protein
MLNRIWAFAYALALATSPALAHDAAHVAPGPSDTELGVPGDASDVTSTIRVTMMEAADGRMEFDPAMIVTRRGETLRIVLENAGASEHEFILGTPDELAEHAKMMRDMPEMSHEEPNTIRLQPGTSGEMVWKFGESSGIEFACLVPGHYEAGMRGKILVRDTTPIDGANTSSESTRAIAWIKRTRRSRP